MHAKSSTNVCGGVYFSKVLDFSNMQLGVLEHFEVSRHFGQKKKKIEIEIHKDFLNYTNSLCTVF